MFAGCTADQAGLDDEPELLGSTASAITAIGDPLPNAPEGFPEAKEAFIANEDVDEGLGPIFNEKGCGNCHTQGAIGGAGVQIERRFGTFFNFFGTPVFDPLANDGNGPFPARGGSLRQLFTVGTFTRTTDQVGRVCTVPLEREPPEATVHNVGRLTTPLFGLGLVDSLPDSTFDNIASSQPAGIRGIANRVTVLIPNVSDPAQSVGMTRVGRFGWKAGVATLTQFAADAYVNEMGITTQSCFKGRSILDFATESQPNGVAQPVGCDDDAPPQPAGNGVPVGVDDAVGACQVKNAQGQVIENKTEIQDDVAEFTEFMTFLAPPTRGTVTAAATRGQTTFQQAGCAGCHVLTTFRTPAAPGNGVPGNFAFNPLSDFLVHDMGGLGDFIGNFGDTVPVTRRMRTAPLWGLRFRTLFLHDGRTGDLATAISQHQGQGAAAAAAFGRLAAGPRADLLAFLGSL